MALPVPKGKTTPVEKSAEEGSIKELVEDAQALLNYIFDQTISTTILKVCLLYTFHHTKIIIDINVGIVLYIHLLDKSRSWGEPNN